jgi:hypothetical protein
MARIRNGALAGQISGSMAGQTFSRNRYGAYVRNRSIPVNPGSVHQVQARGIMSHVASLWGGLTEAQRESWRVWALTNPIMDPFGDSQILAGQAAFNQLNCRLWRQGPTIINVPPTSPAPVGLNTITLSTDIGAGDFNVAFTATPTGANAAIWFWGCVVNSEGIRYVKNKLRLFHRTAGAQASPVDIQAAAVARFGTLTTGAWFHVSVHVFDDATGLVSTPLIASSEIVTT